MTADGTFGRRRVTMYICSTHMILKDTNLIGWVA